MNKVLFLLSSFSLATIALPSQSSATLTRSEMKMVVGGMLGAICEIHHENNFSYSIAKKYTTQYINNAEKKYLSKSEVEDIKSSVLNVYPNCPFP